LVPKDHAFGIGKRGDMDTMKVGNRPGISVAFQRLPEAVTRLRESPERSKVIVADAVTPATVAVAVTV